MQVNSDTYEMGERVGLCQITFNACGLGTWPHTLHHIYLYITETPRNQVPGRKTGISAMGPRFKIACFWRPWFLYAFSMDFRFQNGSKWRAKPLKLMKKSVCIFGTCFCCFRSRFFVIFDMNLAWKLLCVDRFEIYVFSFCCQGRGLQNYCK